MSKLLDFIFRKRTNLEIAIEESTQEQVLAQNIFAIQSGINLIASALANCEFQTVYSNKAIKAEEYYLWNVQPNPNQTKVEFLNKLVSNLIWRNEALIIEVAGNLYVADDFSCDIKAFYPDTFKDIVVRNQRMYRTYQRDEVIYLQLNDADITALLNGLLAGYKRLLTLAMGKYKRAGGRKGVVHSGINPQGSIEWQQALSDLYGDKFKKYFESENALVVLPTGQDYEEISGEGSKKSTSDVVDIINLKNEVYTEVGRAFKIAPSLLMGNVSDLDSSTDFTLTFAVKPFAKLIQDGINAARYGVKEFTKGNYLHINTNHIRHVEPLKTADKADKLYADGIYNDDELREFYGDLPRNTAESQEYVRTRNYETMKGGEKNEKSDTEQHSVQIQTGSAETDDLSV